jgi:hypothetical protein
MAFEIKCCKCGKIDQIEDERKGRTARCTCGQRTTLIPSPDAKAMAPAIDSVVPLNLEGATLKIPLGPLHTNYGSLFFNCEVTAQRSTSMTMTAVDGDRRRSCVTIFFDSATFEQLKTIVAKIDEVFKSARR